MLMHNSCCSPCKNDCISGDEWEANDAESYGVAQPWKATEDLRFWAIHYKFDKICDFEQNGEDIEGSRFEGSLKFGWFDAFQYTETLAGISRMNDL